VSFSVLSLLVRRREGDPADKNFCFETLGMTVDVSRWSTARSTLWAITPAYFRKKYVKSFRLLLSVEDIRHMNEWRDWELRGNWLICVQLEHGC